MKWIKKSDQFTLSRAEVCDLVLFNLAWMFKPKRERPCGYEEFHKNILTPLDGLLIQYLPSLVRKLGKVKKRKRRANPNARPRRR